MKRWSKYCLGSATACLRLALIATSTFVAAGANAAETSGSVQAKLAYCEDCHGTSGQGFHGYFPIPRLAGQQPQYLINQLKAFIEHRRTNNIMFNVAHSLNTSMMNALAADFHGLNPPPLGGGLRQIESRGQ